MHSRVHAIECPPGLCQRESEAGRRPWRERGSGFLAGVLCAAVVAAAAVALPVERLAEAATSLTAPARPVERAELPREWRWERKPVTFDHMFRSR